MVSNRLSDTPLGEPAELIAGDTWTWKRTDLGEFPTADYTLAYRALREAATPDVLTVPVVENADGTYSASKAAADTASIVAGKWHWTLTATRDSDGARQTLDKGTFAVLPNPATGTADPRSHTKRVLDALESLIEGKAAKDVGSYSIAGRSLNRLTPDELVQWRDRYAAKYAREQDAERALNGKPSRRTIKTRFS